MKIESHIPQVVPLSDIPIGECFEYGGEYFIKTAPAGGVALDTGVTVTSDKSMIVKSVRAKVVIEP